MEQAEHQQRNETEKLSARYRLNQSMQLGTFSEVSLFENERPYPEFYQHATNRLSTISATVPFENSRQENSIHTSSIAPPLSIGQQTAVLVVPNVTWEADFEKRKLETATKRLARKRRLDAKRLCQRLGESTSANTGETDLSFDCMAEHAGQDLATLLMKFAEKRRRDARKH